MSTTEQQRAEEVAGRLLASLDLVDAAHACALLRIETKDPEGVVQSLARRNEIIVLTKHEALALPSFQFDIEEGRVFDIIHRILRLRPSDMSDLRLCYWLNRAHADFGCAPATLLGKSDQSIVYAFMRNIEPSSHG
ncbi:hypothetical protein [Falsirhodobacter algicola]|uniref:Uncharacterized protein n=1 Tax=Falsirhodobacter algicola TaxID=2692330 RepID=A0A8J8MVE0_9RHOB|nr:hypothetical protein [Falsirhodobacter algicola]QUS37427.1 hypothetical protein GR316_13700 [Falsirhodobacter algicola]